MYGIHLNLSKQNEIISITDRKITKILKIITGNTSIEKIEQNLFILFKNKKLFEIQFQIEAANLHNVLICLLYTF